MKVERVYEIDASGDVVLTLNSDDLPDFGERGLPVRASYIEPGLVPGSQGWDVVLSDAEQNGRWKGYVIATGIPLDKRALALQIEADFINTHILGALGDECHECIVDC